MRLSRSVKEPAELLCFLWDSGAERGRPSASLCHACSHGHEQRALFSTDMSCVRDLPSLYRSPDSPPSVHDEHVPLFSCQTLTYGQMNTQTHHWMKPLYIHRQTQTHTRPHQDTATHAQPPISDKDSIQHTPRTQKTAAKSLLV